ncbi:MAG: hypothetical protein OXC69_10235 [Candidatus Tectomicrobia bacterium]|nr:hypothetical protein [Candidatus Tectomicrobia bacterium]
MNKQVHRSVFELGGKSVPGILTLNGSKSALELWSTEYFHVKAGHVRGTTKDAKCVTIIDCLESSPKHTFVGESGAYNANVTFHLATVGQQHVDADDECILAVAIGFDELKSITRDRKIGPFGVIHDPDPDIVQGLRTHRPKWQPEVKDHPTVVYFGGDSIVLSETPTDIGAVSFNRGLTGSIGDGIQLKDDPTTTIAFDSPLTVRAAQERMEVLRFFLGLLIGFLPTVEYARLATSLKEPRAGRSYSDIDLELHTPMAHVLSKEDLAQNRAGRALLDCEGQQRREELSNVMGNWFRRNANDERWRANWRFLGSFLRGRSYSIDRIIAAANMFDLLPKDDWPPKLKNLKKKVKCKAKPVLKYIDSGILPKLDEVIDHAVDCRNHYVHGNQARLDYEAGNVLAFLTDTLEFVFGVSELIECGWDAEILAKLQPNDHPFAAYVSTYESSIDGSGI